jgi:hypothetical protein
MASTDVHEGSGEGSGGHRSLVATSGLEQYEQAFRENRIEADLLPSLTAEDLKDLGVTLVGDRRRLLDAIAALRLGASTVTEPGPPSEAGSDSASRSRARSGDAAPIFGRHFPDTEVVGRDLPSSGGLRQRNSITADFVDSQNGKTLAPLGRNSLLLFIKAYLCPRRLSHLTSSPGHAGAGGARSWAINIRIFR